MVNKLQNTSTPMIASTIHYSTLISLIRASSKVRVSYNWSVTNKLNLFHSLMSKPKYKVSSKYSQ